MPIHVISSTTREGRFSEKVASWVTQQLASRPDYGVEPVDLAYVGNQRLRVPKSPALSHRHFAGRAKATERTWRKTLVLGPVCRNRAVGASGTPHASLEAQ